eukprot:362673-Chlamydomonas_euryale.AAC.1
MGHQQPTHAASYCHLCTVGCRKQGRRSSAGGRAGLPASLMLDRRWYERLTEGPSEVKISPQSTQDTSLPSWKCCLPAPCAPRNCAGPLPSSLS